MNAALLVWLLAILGAPDPRLTPGATDPSVTQQNIAETNYRPAGRARTGASRQLAAGACSRPTACCGRRAAAPRSTT
jgi:hypothetical protein